MAANGWCLRDLYRTLETPGVNRLRDAHAALDSAVRAAYGMKEKEDPLAVRTTTTNRAPSAQPVLPRPRALTEPGLRKE
jgi:hypothetical protein